MPNQKQPTREEFVKSLFLIEEKDNIFSGKEARNKLVKGISKGVEAIKVSYGATGSNAIIEEYELPYHRVTNDGKMILKDIKLVDKVENIGMNILREVAEKQDKESGDGRKTAIILTGAILEEGMKCKESPMEIKKSLDECLPIILKSIDEQTKTISEKDIKGIATVASESEKLGSLFGEIYQKIGKDGIIELDNSGLPDTFYETKEGVRLLNCKFMYPYMANEDKGRKASFIAPYVLITKQKIVSIGELDSILRQVANKGKNELVIFCEDIDLSVSQALAFLHQGLTPDGKSITPFKTLVIKAPVLWKDWLFEDFSKITNATIIDPQQGKTLKNFQFNWLGYCDKIITDKDETIVLHNKDISEHISKLEEDNTDDAKLRIARLKTKTAILKLGANSESELSYIRGKALDARNASYLALQGGVVKGGGHALMQASKTIKNNILTLALCYPMEQILENSKDIGISSDIYDPAIVVKNAITNALSVASTILTTNLVVTKK